MRVIVKIGTSSLTGDSGEVNMSALSKLVSEVVVATDKNTKLLCDFRRYHRRGTEARNSTPR